jgi:hypothetical protein
MNNNQWVVAKRFVSPESTVCVEVQVLNLGPNTKYSISIGDMRDNRISRFVAPRIQVQNAVVGVAHDGMKIARLFDEATLYIQEQLQVAEDKRILSKQMKEQRQVERENGTQSVAHTGKTQREVAKRARHENNLAARRAADQDRTSRSKSAR